MIDIGRIKATVEAFWEDAAIPSLIDYIKIPNKSPAFDSNWVEHGYMKDAVALMERFARPYVAKLHATLEVVQLPNRTPVILIEVPGNNDDTVLLYGHLDKQPEMTGWRQGYGPWTPIREGDKLFGRGGADDGYAMYAALGALLALKEQNIPHARCVLLIEACEESGSYDLPFYVDHLAGRLGEPSLVVCLDSGCGDYERLWLTTSLRGTAIGTLTVRVLTEGVHSGDASGIVPSSFRVIRALLSRLEDEESGIVKLRELYANIPEPRKAEALRTAEVLGKDVYAKFPFEGETRPVTEDPSELILNRTWRPFLSVTGAEGLPAPKDAGAVALPYVTLKLSMRLPPTLDARMAFRAMKELLEADPPYGSKVSFSEDDAASGWNAPATAKWLESAVNKASQAFFAAPAAAMGEGGSIPFMGMLGKKFPEAQFVITGVLGPQSNAHGPNEFLHLPTAKRISSSITSILADHFTRSG